MHRKLAAAAIAAAAFGAGTEALAQDQTWLKDRRYTEGPGVRVGDFELHPGLAAELGFDTNYLRSADDAGTAGAVRLRITPSISLSTLGPQRTEGAASAPPPDAEFRGTLSLTYNEFFGVSGPPNLQSAVSSARNINGNLDLNLNLFPRREWSGALFASAGRTSQPSDTGAFSQFSGAFDRFLTRAGAELIYTPGAGLLDWRLGYRFSGTIFQNSQVGGLTNLENTIQTRGRWRFLPRTAMIFDARFGFINYVDEQATGNKGSKTGSHPLRVQLGVNGLVTPSFGVLAMGGWGASFYDPHGLAHDFDSFIGQAEVKWFLTPNPSSDPAAASLSVSSVSLGFLRDFSDSFLGTYVERDMGYANLSYFFGGRFLVVLDGRVGPEVFPFVESVNGVQQNLAPFTNIRYEASLFGEYRLKDYLGLNASLRYSGNASDTRIKVETGTTMGTVLDSLQWQTFEAYLGARFMM